LAIFAREWDLEKERHPFWEKTPARGGIDDNGEPVSGLKSAYNSTTNNGIGSKADRMPLTEERQ